MKKSSVRFFKCIQNAQELGTSQEYMQSILFFDLIINGTELKDLKCTIKQTVGTNYEVDQSLEVFTPPIGIAFNYSKFREAAKTYYMGLIGAHGSAIKVVNSSVIMYNTVIEMEKKFDISDN